MVTEKLDSTRLTDSYTFGVPVEGGRSELTCFQVENVIDVILPECQLRLVVLLLIGAVVVELEVRQVCDFHRVPGEVIKVPWHSQVQIKLCRVTTECNTSYDITSSILPVD